MPADRVIRDAENDEPRPFVLAYAERRSVEERGGRYDETNEIWVVNDTIGEMPLVRSRAEMLEETLTRSPENTDPPRRPRKSKKLEGSSSSMNNQRVLLDETVSSYQGDPTDPPRPRRSGKSRYDRGSSSSNDRLALDETITKVTGDPTDVSRPRRETSSRAGKPRPFPDETLTFTSESTDESRPRRSGF